jgi:hypothetical protein
MVQEAFDEHEEVSDLLDEIDGLHEQGSELRPRIMELKEMVEHHVQEEETEMFPKVRQAIDEDELNRMGDELESEKRSFSPAA